MPLHLVAGWLDATASPAICAFLNGQHAAGARKVCRQSGMWGLPSGLPYSCIVT